MPKFYTITLDDFQRAFDELFDDLLIGPWRLAQAVAQPGNALVHDLGDRYEVHVALGDANPNDVEVEVSERTLKVRVPGESGSFSESSFSFPEPVQHDTVTANASAGDLAITLPKSRTTRRVRVQKNPKPS
jgi:HSP20 family molecular chaperone IbpA